MNPQNSIYCHAIHEASHSYIARLFGIETSFLKIYEKKKDSKNYIENAFCKYKSIGTIPWDQWTIITASGNMGEVAYLSDKLLLPHDEVLKFWDSLRYSMDFIEIARYPIANKKLTKNQVKDLIFKTLDLIRENFNTIDKLAIYLLKDRKLNEKQIKNFYLEHS